MKLGTTFWLAGCLWLLASQTFGQSGRERLAIADVHPTPAVAESVKRAGKTLSMNRVIESLDGQLMDRINSTRRFELVSRSDLRHILKEQDLAASGNVDLEDPATARRFSLAGVKYLVVTTVDDFQDASESATFAGTGRAASRRIIRLSAVAKVYNSTTASLLESANIQTSAVDTAVRGSSTAQDGDVSDALLLQIARETAEKIAHSVANAVFPIRVLAKRERQVTINRGQGGGVEVGEIWNVFALGEDLIDFDTGDNLGPEEVQVGSVRVVQVNPQMSLAEVLEDHGIERGAILRRPPPQL